MRTSALSTSLSSVATPFGSFMLSAIERLPRASRSSVGAPTRSTRTTSAPKSARIMPQYGPGARPAISTTRMPSSAPMGALPSECAHHEPEDAQPAERRGAQLGDGTPDPGALGRPHQRPGERDHAELPELDADVEPAERQHEPARRQRQLVQDPGEAESVDQPECEGDRDAQPRRPRDTGQKTEVTPRERCHPEQHAGGDAPVP